MKFAIVGAPNSGKSVLFNFLTGLHQKVANYPGCTVMQKVGKITFAKEHTCVDLPGTYSLHHKTQDASIATDYILNYKQKEIDKFILVCDSTVLQRSLILALQMKELNIPTILVLNMEDELLLHGGKIDVEYLQKELGIPVFLLSATRKWNVMPLVKEIRTCIEKEKESDSHKDTTEGYIPLSKIPSIQQLEQEIIRVSNKANLRLSESHNTSDKIDTILLHPLWGRIILLVVALVIFQAMFTWTGPAMDGIEAMFGWLAALIKNTLPATWISDLITDGVIVGVGSVIVFLPQIIILTFAIGAMEMTGYMARAIFLIDSLLSKVGLNGKIFMPLLTGHACAIPGIMATRTIGSNIDRLLAIFAVPFMSCSARLPVYTILITAFIPDEQVAGIISIRTIVLFGLYLMGSVLALVLSGIAKLFYLTTKGSNPTLLDRVAEVPTYRLPTPKALFWYSWHRVKMFLKRASTTIFAVSVLFWLLTNIYIPGAEPVIENSIVVLLGKLVHPLFSPLGLDWQSSAAILIGLTAREVFIGAISVLYHTESESGLISTITQNLSFAAGMALLVYYIYAPQCLATFVVMFKETGKRLFTIISFFIMFFIAYILGWLTYIIFS